MDVILAFIHDNSTFLATLATGWFGYKATVASHLGKSQYQSLKDELQEVNQTVTKNCTTLGEQGQTLLEVQEDMSLTKSGVLGNRRRVLFKDMKEAIRRGYKTLEECRETAILYDGYEQLGGNGEIKALYDIYMKLPIKED